MGCQAHLDKDGGGVAMETAAQVKAVGPFGPELATGRFRTDKDAVT